MDSHPDMAQAPSHELEALHDVAARLPDEQDRRKLAESALAEMQARYKALAEQIPAVVYTCALDEWSTILHASPQAEALLGLAPAEFTNDPDLWRKHLHPDDSDRVMRELRECSARGDTLSLEYRMIARDGQVRWFMDRAVVVRDNEGCPLCLQGIMLDVTERKRIEERLQASEEQYRLLLQTIPHGIGEMDAAGIIVFCNPEFARLSGREVHEVIGHRAADFCVTEADREQTRAFMEMVVREQPPPSPYINRLLRKDGRIVICQADWTYKRNANGQVVGFVSVVTDITERTRAEEALRASEARSRALLETAPNGVLSLDEQGRIELFNPAAEELFGYSAAEAVGRDGRALIPAFYDTLPPAGDGAASVGQPGKTGGEAVGRHKDGTTFPIELAVGEVRLGDRRHFTAIVHDLTDQKSLQEQLFQAQKMEAIGRLAGGIAHDFNNLLTIFSCNIDLMGGLLAAQASPDPTLLSSLDQMRRAWKSASGLTRQLLAFSRRQVIRPQSLDPAEVIGSLERMLRPLIGEHILFEVACERNIGHILADAGHIEQVVMNLVINARDAMTDGGVLKIQAGRVTLVPGRPPVPEAAGGAYLCIKVSDTGVGMTPDIVKHLFEPFYTTKPLGKGTGLGLPTVYGIVRQAGGYIAVESEPRRGTTVRVYLPITEQQASRAAASAPKACGGKETILLCEDEAMILRLAAQILRANGYQVLPAGSPRQAVELAAAHSGSIHMLVTDVIMPEMNGRRLAEMLRTSYPALLVLFVSGYTADIIGEHGVVTEGIDFLEKPFTPAGLLKRVREVLDRSSAGALSPHEAAMV